MKHNFSPIQNPLKDILKKYNLYESFEIQELFNNWEKIVGTTLANISVPISFNPERNIIVLKLKSDSWKREFYNQKNRLLKTINNQLKEIQVNDLVFE